MAQLSIQARQKTSMMDFSSYENAMRWATLIANSDICPKDCKGKPGDVLVRIEFGNRLGLPPMQALTNIATINGRPSIYGDALMGLCLASPLCENITESFDEKTMTATCTVKRKDKPVYSQSFSEKDARLAGLLGRQGPWSQYPRRMLQMRARAWALRDVFADLLGGISVLEEVQDIALEREPAQVVSLSEFKKKGPEATLLKRFQKVQEPKDPEIIIIDAGAAEEESIVEEEPDIHTQLCEMVEHHKVPQATINAWLQKAQVSTLAELYDTQAEAIINMLNKRKIIDTINRKEYFYI